MIDKLWIVTYAHRCGLDAWPEWSYEKPTLKTLLASNAEFARDWEGFGRPDGRLPRDDETLEVFGPFPLRSPRPKNQQKPHEVRIPGWKCLCCGYTWPRRSRYPVKCAKCKNPYWDKPRTLGGKKAEK